MKRLLVILKEMTGAPSEFQVLPEGKIEINGEEPAYMDENAASMIIAAWKDRGNDMVIDYEHQSLTDGQSPAAGWIKKLTWKGKEGLWVVVEWTSKAAEYLKNREYRYFSPVMLVNKKDRRVAVLVNVALTNNPAINNLKPIMAKFTDVTVKHGEKEDVMNEKLRKLLCLAADAGEDKIIEAVTLSINKATPVACKEVLDALGAKTEAGKDEVVRIVASLKGSTVVACKEVMEALGVQTGAGKEEVLRVVASLKAPGDVAVQLSQQVAELTSKISSMEQQDLVTLALKEGKTSPEELDKWGRDLALKAPEQFKLIVLSRPAGSVIPVASIVVAKDKAGVVPDDLQKSVNRMMGIDDATFAKYNK